MGPGKGMYILGIWTMDPMGSILIMFRPWMGYDYTAIQVICWVELPKQMRLCPIFLIIWILINWTQQCGIGLLEVHRNSAS